MNCTRCTNVAMLRIDPSTVLCKDCWREVERRFVDDFNSSFAVASFGESVVTATPSPPAKLVVTTDNSSSCGGVKESSVSIPEYNGVKSPALLTAHGLSGKSCPLSRSEIGPQDSIDLTIPTFLRRDESNVPPFARAS